MADSGSDATYDYCCNGLFKKHQPFGRKELKKWPVVKTAMDLLLKCLKHPDHRIELFCEDHMELCCVLCHLHNHKPCKKVVQTAEKAKTMSQSDFQRLAATLVAEEQNLVKEIDMANECLQKLQEACEKAHKEIQLFRKKVNDLLEHLERNTVQSLDTLFNTLREAIQSDKGKCSKLKEDLKGIQEAIKHVDTGGPNVQTFIAHSKSTEIVSNTHKLLKEISASRNDNITFQGNPAVEQYLSGLSDLGNVDGSNRGSGEIVKCEEKMLCSVKLGSDKQTCHIKGICDLPNGELLMVDMANERVKLIDMHYKVVAHTYTKNPHDICRISPTEVAVASNGGCTIQFLAVNNRQIVVGRTFNFEHYCNGIAYNKGNLFLTSGTALYQYTLDGQLMKKIYEDTSHDDTVYKCAVSADGSRLYVTDADNSRLLTLSMDGNVLSSLGDHALLTPTGVHVSETGQLLVCGFDSFNVVQVVGECGVVELDSKGDDHYQPESVYYSARTGRLIVGQFSDNIHVIHTK